MSTAPTTVPPLQKGDRIEDWRHLFEADTQHLVGEEDGDRKTIHLLPYPHASIGISQIGNKDSVLISRN